MREKGHCDFCKKQHFLQDFQRGDFQLCGDETAKALRREALEDDESS